MKKVLLYLLLAVVSGAICGMLYKTIKKVEAKKVVGVKLQTLSEMPLWSMDSTAFSQVGLNKDQPTIIIFFNSACGYCQYEAEEIAKNIMKFEKSNLLMVSSEPIQKIIAFAKSYGLEDQPQIYFTKIDEGHIFDTFGSISVPHLFIYNKDRKLIREFKGETKVEAILKYL